MKSDFTFVFFLRACPQCTHDETVALFNDSPLRQAKIQNSLAS